MRRALTWFAGLVGVAALVRALRRRAARVPVAPPAAPGPEDPAAELRRRLDETRTTAEAGTAETTATGGEDGAAALAERRARVHARAQEALDLMREPPESR